MMGLMFYFLVAAVALIGASVIIGLFLTNSSSIVSHLPIERRKKHPILIALGLECFSRHQTQARLAGVLRRRR
jgi:hypothetical protein